MPSVERMTTASTLADTAQAERVGFLRQLGVDTGYTLLGFPLAVVSFSVIVTGLSAGLSTLVIVVGVPILTGTLFIARAFADIERLRIPAVLRRPRTRPIYRAAQPGAGVWKRIVTPLTQVQFWLDLAHGILSFPIAVATFCVVVSWWAAAIGGTLTIAWDWSIPRGPDNQSLAQLIGLGDSTFARIALQTAIGVVCLITLPIVVRGCALISGAFSRFLLTGVAEMRQTITVLTEQKAAAASAEATALRRLERDIHDGPQQRLVRLAMDLSRARQQLDSDPDALRDALDEALSQTQETLDELRALSRGIAPPVLTDRGLPQRAGRARRSVHRPGRARRRPRARHAGWPARRGGRDHRVLRGRRGADQCRQAQRRRNCWVTVAHGPGRIGVEIVDDGGGGAHLAKGHGLAGLADRRAGRRWHADRGQPAPAARRRSRVELPC